MATDYEQMRIRDEHRRAEMHSLFKAIARLMPDWSIKRDEETGGDYRSYVLERDGMSIHIARSHAGACDKVTVGTWGWPEFKYKERGDERKQSVTPRELYDPREESPSISISISRGAEAIVKDIRRRFLPEYERIYARCVEKAQQSQAFHNKSRAAWEAVCKVIGKTPEHGSHHYGTHNYSGGIRIESRSDGCKVEFDTDAAGLQKIITALNLKPDTKS